MFEEEFRHRSRCIAEPSVRWRNYSNWLERAMPTLERFVQSSVYSIQLSAPRTNQTAKNVAQKLSIYASDWICKIGGMVDASSPDIAIYELKMPRQKIASRHENHEISARLCFRHPGRGATY
jgi:hypothetical protein